MKKNITKLLDKPMDRKEFLKNIGIGSLFMLGGGMIYQSLQEANTKPRKVVGAYGASAYGGRRRG
jgi:hypothetical protein